MKIYAICAIPVLFLSGHVMALDLGQTPQQAAAALRADALEKAGRADMKAGEWAAAVTDLRASITAGAWNSNAYAELAEALTRQGNTREALHVYRELFYRKQVDIGLAPDLATALQDPTRNDFGTGAFPAWMKYALLLSQTGQWREAVNVYEKALPRTPGGGDLPAITVHFKPGLPQPKELQSALHIALGLDNNFRGDGDPNQALKEYENALQLEPNWDLANFYYGFGLQRLGRTDQARAAFQKTIKIGKGGVKAAAEQALKHD